VQQIRQRFSSAIITAGQQIAMIAAIILCASIIVGVLGQTGLGVKITSLIIDLSGGWLWAALLLTALACLILGMEVPTTAAYVICISVAGPALQQLGVPLLAAHLFVFWFALLSTITPPVCGTVFIAAGMIGENWLKVAVTAMSLGLGLYIIDGCQSGDHGPCERARCGPPGTGADRTWAGADLLCVDRRVHAVAPCSAWFGGICGVVWSSYAGLNLFGPLLRPPYEVMSRGPARPRCVGS
jgi:hypothetical protein